MKISKSLWVYSGLPKSLYILFFARIINSMGNFVFPFLTLFLTDKMGIGETETGFYMMLVATAFVPGSLLGGKLADYMGRKKIFIIFQSLAAISFIPCAFLGNSLLIPWFLIGSTFFNGAAQPATSAMLADLTTPENRKLGFSLLYLGTNIGFAIGPLIAGFLYNNYVKVLFLGDAMTTFLSLILVGIYVNETIPSKENISESKKLDTDEKAEDGSLIVVLFKRPLLLGFAVVSIINSFVYSQFSFSLPIQAEETFGIIVGSKFYGMVMTVNALTVITMTVTLTNITRKIKPILNIVIGSLLFAIGFGIVYYIDTLMMLLISTIIWTLGEILNHTNSGVYIANHTPMSHRGRFNAVIPIIMGAGHAIGPLIMGNFIEENEVRLVWPLLFILSVGAALLMLILYMVESKRKISKRASL